MNKRIAFLSGVAGGIVMTIFLIIARLFGVPINLSTWLGSAIGLTPGLIGTWVVGFMIHLVISGLIGLVYGLGFEHVVKRASLWTGVAFAGIHALIGGLAVGIMPLIHPYMPSVLPEPGFFLGNFGWVGVTLFVGIHLLYGMIVGGVYGNAPEEREGAVPTHP